MTIAVIYRTNGAWGTGQGTNLSAAQVDTNFYNLAQAIITLQTDAPQPNNIASISQSGTSLVITLTDSTAFTLALPAVQFRWRGDWAPSTSYLALDAFKVDGVGLFSVLVNHTSAGSFDEGAVDGSSNPLYFKMFGFSGVTGVLADLNDIAITSIADDDVFVWDNSAGKWRNQRAKYVIGAFASGIMPNNAKLLYHCLAKAVTIPANCGAYLGLNSQAGGSANATGNTVITIAQALAASPNTFATVGTITIGAGGVTPTFSTTGAAPISFAQGDVLRLTGPSTADATFADLYVTLVGFET